jgi:endonuclease G, mitochondrial
MISPRFCLVVLALLLPALATTFVGERPAISALTTRTFARNEVETIHLLLGNPSRATEDLNSADNYLIVKPQYVLSYNKSKGGPNWVSWHLEYDDLGRGRFGKFFTDVSLPADWQIKPQEFVTSGFDRGQMCPPQDRNSNSVDNEATYAMSNVLAQLPQLNRGAWYDLEEYCRDLVRKRDKELYIVAGGYGSRGMIAENRINIPKRYWKIIIILPNGDNDLERITPNTPAIAVDIPNGELQDSWAKYITTINDIEANTGYSFLTNIRSSAQKILKAKKYRLSKARL